MKIKIVLLIIISQLNLSFLIGKEPQNLTPIKDQIIEYYDSGKYEKEVKKLINKAINHFDKIKINKTTLFIFDIDETCFSFYKLLKSVDFGHQQSVHNEWIKKDLAPTITHTKRFYDYLVKRGCSIAFITGNPDSVLDAIVHNLKAHGFNSFVTCIARKPSESSIPTKEFKLNHRKKLSEKYKIVGCIGDQLNDLYGSHGGYKIKLPNPMYVTK